MLRMTRPGTDDLASSPTDGQYYDPWGTRYVVKINGDLRQSIS